MLLSFRFASRAQCDGDDLGLGTRLAAGSTGLALLLIISVKLADVLGDVFT